MTPELTVFLIEDDAAVRKGCEQALRLADLSVQAFADAESALATLSALADPLPGVVITDVRLPGIDGFSLLQNLQQRDRELPVVLVTGHGDVTMAVQAMREGAYDFIEKPFAPDRLVDVTRRALERRELWLENCRLRDQLGMAGAVPRIGQSPAMQRIQQLIHALAPTDVDILINGETGTGKEVVASAVHAASGRRGPFVALNCGALPESVFESEVFGHEPGAFTGATKRRIGKIEYAKGGTLFLDEIESMPLDLQVKLLRVLQERVVVRLGSNEPVPVDCRFIAASKVNLKTEAEAGRFRADLYYRLNVVSVDLPPLRERREDIPFLMAGFLHSAAQRFDKPVPEWSAADMKRWQQHDWPGNVRELKNVAERFCLGLPDGLPEGLAGAAVSAATATTVVAEGASLADKLEQAERSFIEAALREAQGQVAKAAELLQLPRKTLYDKLTRLGIDAEAFRN
ncbi:MAG TPA: sigma-54 dependent transcriptional regulator [Rhodocyclaceae bacterium]|jgi:two-component system C4-dicarboxylate transport response regulator DctD|nr:sigma-54 dependent transcriptional regulator [Rhodocyclaceae bacterium]